MNVLCGAIECVVEYGRGRGRGGCGCGGGGVGGAGAAVAAVVRTGLITVLYSYSCLARMSSVRRIAGYAIVGIFYLLSFCLCLSVCLSFYLLCH